MPRQILTGRCGGRSRIPLMVVTRSRGRRAESPVHQELPSLLYCRNCYRCNHGTSPVIEFQILEQRFVNTLRPYCTFTADDLLKNVMYNFCNICFSYLQKGHKEIDAQSWTYIWPGFYWLM